MGSEKIAGDGVVVLCIWFQRSEGSIPSLDTKWQDERWCCTVSKEKMTDHFRKYDSPLPLKRDL